MNNEDGTRLLAAALYEIRLLLANRVGRVDHTPESEAAAIAYALHNEALAVLRGETVDVDAALAKLAIVDQRLGTTATARLTDHLAG